MDKIEVTQADIDAWEIYGPQIFHCEMTGPEALAAHRATCTDATPVAWMYSCGQIRVTYPKRADGSINGIPLSEWTQTPLYTHPPATDVAALVEAAKKIMPIRVYDGPDYAEVYFADGEEHRTHAMTMNPQDWLDLSAALAPFTKGQNDD
mgnify:FL=1